MIEYKKGDLLASDCDVIVHGCNCKLSMGAGIARQIKEQFPKAHEADLKTTWGDKSKLGTYTLAHQHGKFIINAYTQFNYTTSEIDADYDAIRSVMEHINDSWDSFDGGVKNYFDDDDIKMELKIGMPRIGCGLAGGDWNVVEQILNETFGDRVIYVYDYGQPDWTHDGTKWVRAKKTYKNATWDVRMEGH